MNILNLKPRSGEILIMVDVDEDGKSTLSINHTMETPEEVFGPCAEVVKMVAREMGFPAVLIIPETDQVLALSGIPHYIYGVENPKGRA